MILLVAGLATAVASLLSGNAPAPWITVLVSAVLGIGLVLGARWLWRTTRTVGGLMDAADRVAGGDYTTRVEDADSRQLGRLTRSFNEMTERLETSEERRRELLADVAHELRTPLQVIRGTLEGMLDGLYPMEPARLEPLLEETTVMTRLLDDLRTLSMVEAGVLPLHREAIDPKSIADEVVRAFLPIADEAGVSLESVASVPPMSIDVDPVRLSEVLTNLVANALRHTPSGGVVTVRVIGEHGGVVYEIQDTGSGIPAEHLPYVFDRFVTASDRGGTGLGLAIAKRLVEAHGGSIEASSPPGGTLIRVVLG
jgi:two-component system, OmpR family, sensor histidine kinase BaeS